MRPSALSRLRRYSFAPALLIWALIGAVSSSRAEAPSDVDCDGNGPLLSQRWTSIPLRKDKRYLARWRLPVSPLDPRHLTQVRLELRLVRRLDRDGPRWFAKITLPPMKEDMVGLPFTFQKLRLEWSSANESGQSELDWSGSCSGPGFSFFPLPEPQTVFVELSGVGELGRLDSLRFRLWGGRN